MKKGKYDDQSWIGKRYGRYTVLSAHYAILNNGKRMCRWLCRCDCGAIKDVRPIEVINGKVVSCGCHRNDIVLKRNTTHGESASRLYRIWCGMKRRCNAQNCEKYKIYGGRGISVCDEWIDYELFSVWAKSNGYREDLSIERIDSNGNYEPGNCTWIPMKKQARSRRSTYMVDYNGEKVPLIELSEKTGIHRTTVFHRVKNLGWSVERALSEPIHIGSR